MVMILPSLKSLAAGNLVISFMSISFHSWYSGVIILLS